MRTVLLLVIALIVMGSGLSVALAHGPLGVPQFPPLRGPGAGPGGGSTPFPGIPGFPGGGNTPPPAGGETPAAPAGPGGGGANGGAAGVPFDGPAGGAETPAPGGYTPAGGATPPPAPAPTPTPAPAPAPAPTPAPGGATGAPQPGGEIPFATAAGRRKKAATLESATTWETWWTINRDRFIDLRQAMRESGGLTPNAARVTAKDLAAAHERMRKHVVPFLRRGLDDSDPFVRAHSVFALGKLGAPAKCKHITPSLQDSSKAVRDSAILALGLLRSGDAADLLGEIAGDTKIGREALGRSRKLDSETRVLASLALGLAGKEGDRVASGGLPVLLDLVRAQHANADIAIAAAIGLGVVGEAGAIPALLAVIEDTSVDGHVRAAAVNSLGKIGDARTLTKLAAILADDDVQVRRSATVAMGQIAQAADIETVERLTTIATDESDRIQRNFAIMALGRIGGTSARSTLAGLVRKGDLYERTFAAVALGVDGRLRGAADADVCKLLMAEMVKTKTAHERGAFVVALGLLGHRDAAPYLRAVVTQPGDIEVRAHAALGLGMMKDRAGLPVLRQALRERVSTSLQTSSTIALGLIGDAEATILLREIFEEDAFREARNAAVRGLGMIGRDEIAFCLGRLLVEADGSTASIAKAFAAEALGVYGDKDDIPAMSSLAAGTNFTCSRGILDRVLRAVL